MATQYTKERETKLVLRGYEVVGVNLTHEELERLRLTHFATEMRYTTEVRGEPEYKIWARPKGELIDENTRFAEVDVRGQDLFGEWNIERSRIAVERAREDKPGLKQFVVKTSNGFAWREDTTIGKEVK